MIFASSSYHLLAWITKKTNSTEACYFQRKMNKDLHAFLKRKRSAHILVVTTNIGYSVVFKLSATFCKVL